MAWEELETVPGTTTGTETCFYPTGIDITTRDSVVTVRRGDVRKSTEPYVTYCGRELSLSRCLFYSCENLPLSPPPAFRTDARFHSRVVGPNSTETLALQPQADVRFEFDQSSERQIRLTVGIRIKFLFPFSYCPVSFETFLHNGPTQSPTKRSIRHEVRETS
ncbi:hypothetical protein HZH66_000869 [Vespula vulgaris]|uniref:Uncharacterized protein n=1 Tax=Vespula vulgaris TaxID=7454 RepID=A0A834KS69_VESVU|nr:hypothetical protein HZH66_000869 [Vespula vulgaris]